MMRFCPLQGCWLQTGGDSLGGVAGCCDVEDGDGVVRTEPVGGYTDGDGVVAYGVLDVELSEGDEVVEFRVVSGVALEGG